MTDNLKKILQNITQTAQDHNLNLYKDQESLQLVDKALTVIKNHEEGERNRPAWVGIGSELEGDTPTIRQRFINLNQQRRELQETVDSVQSFMSEFSNALEGGIYNVKEILGIFQEFKKVSETSLLTKITEIRNSYPGIGSSNPDTSMIKSILTLEVEIKTFPERGPRTVEDFDNMAKVKEDFEYVQNVLSAYKQKSESETSKIDEYQQEAIGQHQNALEEIRLIVSKI